MPEVTLTQAAEIVSKDRVTVFRWVENGLLPARREGIRRDIFIEEADLEKFASDNDYRYNTALARQYAK
jgi:predicted site-specific integrase-resolvase